MNEFKETSGPLSDIKVLDVTQMMAGPFCSMLLADMGADVVKIEKPEGDDIRRAGPPFINGESAAFLGINRNKRSISIDLSLPEGQEILRRMSTKADVLVQNMRPETVRKHKLSYPDIKKVNPAIIYCTISGFGTTGPYSDRPGFDLVAQGMSGLMSITGTPDGPPMRHGVPVTDLAAGFYGAFGILTAYINRMKSGEGQHVETSLLEAGIAYTIWESAIYFATGKSPGPVGSGHPLIAPYQAFRTRNGYIVVGAANQANWERFCEAINRQDLLQDSMYTTGAMRKSNQEELASTIENTLTKKDTDYWQTILDNAGVPNGPINDLEAVYNDPHVKARNMVKELSHPIAGLIKNIGLPLKLSETPGSIRVTSPTLGQHTEQILAEYGFRPSEITSLKNAKVVY